VSQRAPDGAPSARAKAAPARLPIWDGYAEVLRWPAVNSAPFTTLGHLPEQAVDVRVNEAARPSYTALVTDTVFPEGAALSELSHEHTGHGYVMRKISGNWRYFELDAMGGVLTSGQQPWCVGCHAEAPGDHVFGLPHGS
jgi:peptidoglycan/xylan/chitin deacetylase (PgdA/CDA1 family)